MKFITVWPVNEKLIDYDKSPVPDFNLDEQIILLHVDYNWKNIRDFVKNSNPGDFIFFIDKDGVEAITFRNR